MTIEKWPLVISIIAGGLLLGAFVPALWPVRRAPTPAPECAESVGLLSDRVGQATSFHCGPGQVLVVRPYQGDYPAAIGVCRCHVPDAGLGLGVEL